MLQAMFSWETLGHSIHVDVLLELHFKGLRYNLLKHYFNTSAFQ